MHNLTSTEVLELEKAYFEKHGLPGDSFVEYLLDRLLVLAQTENTTKENK